MFCCMSRAGEELGSVFAAMDVRWLKKNMGNRGCSWLLLSLLLVLVVVVVAACSGCLSFVVVAGGVVTVRYRR